MYKRQHFKPESVINWDVMMYNDTGQVHCVNVKGLTQVQSRVFMSYPNFASAGLRKVCHLL